jgi:hypothetical protein
MLSHTVAARCHTFPHFVVTLLLLHHTAGFHLLYDCDTAGLPPATVLEILQHPVSDECVTSWFVCGSVAWRTPPLACVLAQRWWALLLASRAVLSWTPHTPQRAGLCCGRHVAATQPTLITHHTSHMSHASHTCHITHSRRRTCSCIVRSRWCVLCCATWAARWWSRQTQRQSAGRCVPQTGRGGWLGAGPACVCVCVCVCGVCGGGGGGACAAPLQLRAAHRASRVARLTRYRRTSLPHHPNINHMATHTTHANHRCASPTSTTSCSPAWRARPTCRRSCCSRAHCSAWRAWTRPAWRCRRCSRRHATRTAATTRTACPAAVRR